ncbi:LysR substrate-binding domain-containing protein [Celerinatantimonas yamalensis]|uniref:LysR substrate-binding domain-containing protein n=1 Tax=Celerinatantimonas yamalensis TaxID=559956 RepID=A0ABW9G638_9GAMM
MSIKDSKRRLPPLTGLIAADAVARQTSFTAAADELNLTPSAVSHRIRALEDWLGFALFIRNTRTVTLTTLGHHYLQDIAKLLSGLETVTTHALAQIEKHQVIRLQTTDSFANRWLVERLPRFIDAHPYISVQIMTREYTEGFRTTNADIAILYGRGNWEGCIATKVLEETIFPVLSAKMASEWTHSEHLFQSYPLIHDDNLGTTWSDWWLAAEVEPGYSHAHQSKAGLHYNHSHLALKAAERGDGIALASQPLVSDALTKGDLVAPFAFKLHTGYSYYLLHRHIPQMACRMFIDWILREVALSQSFVK